VNEGMAPGNGKMITMDDGSEYVVYENYEDAKEAAKESMQNLFDDIGIEGWNEDFREQFIEFNDNDAQFIAQDEVEARRDEFEDEVRESEEFEEDSDEFNLAVEDKMNEAQDEIEQEILSDPRGYFRDNLGMEDSEINESNFFSVNTDALFEASIEADGVGHTLAGYDGEELELSDGSFMYRTN
jgi:hypothetical protein